MSGWLTSLLLIKAGDMQNGYAQRQSHGTYPAVGRVQRSKEKKFFNKRKEEEEVKEEAIQPDQQTEMKYTNKGI